MQRLKRWESPRFEGRNYKGSGSVRARQLKEQTQMMRQKLKEAHSNNKKRGDDFVFPLLFVDD